MKYQSLDHLFSGPPEPATIRGVEGPIIKYARTGTAVTQEPDTQWLGTSLTNPMRFEEPEEPEEDFYPDPEGSDYYSPPDDELIDEPFPEFTEFSPMQLMSSYSSEDAAREARARWEQRARNGDIRY